MENEYLSTDSAATLAVYVAAAGFIYWAIRLTGNQVTAARFGLAAVFFPLGGALGIIAIGMPTMLIEEFGYDPFGESKSDLIRVASAGFGGWWARVGWTETG